MAKFVELHYDGDPMLINLDKVDAVMISANGATLLWNGEPQDVQESYEEVKKIIGSAQGGIPMEPGRMYEA